MKLGAFSVSLSVKDLKASKVFYENLGFEVFAGDIERKYLIMKNGNALIGLFEGMFENNILTFNPGWDESANKLESFDDVRDIQKHLKSKNIKLEAEADESTSGPANLTLIDPDGNAILIDQHV
ncbi:MAG: VOC family protein [Fulvivirga sp.]